MMKTNKLKNTLLIIFNVIFLLVISFCFHFALLNPFNQKLNKGFVFILFLLLCLGFLFLCFITKNLSKRSLLKISIINLIIFTLLQIFFGYFFAVNPSWDMISIFNSATKVASNEWEFFSSYFYKLYPNNIFITVLWMKFYKLCYYFGFNLILSSVIINIIVVLISVIITYILIKKVFNIRVATISSFLFIVITPFYSYTPIFYTDTLTMIFLPLAFLLFYIYIKSKNKNIFLPIFIGIILAFGIGIKTNIAIGFIALSIFSIFIIDNLKGFFRFISLFLISFIVSSILITSTCQKYIPVPLKDAGLPSTHWIMMGLKDKGGFNKEDVNLSKKAGKTKKEIQEFNIKTIKTRLNNYGICGYSKFLYKKIQYTWGDGTYFAPVKLSRKPIRPNFLHKYIYGDKNNLFTSFSEASHSLLLFLILIGSIGLFKSKNKIGFLFNICIFGVFLFLILWEARSRYLVCILPILVCSSSIGINEILKLKLFSNKKRRLEAK